MNPDLSRLQAYPFEKLRQLFDGIQPNGDYRPVALSIGEPKHAPPQFVLDTLSANLDQISSYPATVGSDHLRNTIGAWLAQRFQLGSIDSNCILPVNGTREALFAIAQAVVDRSTNPLVVYPNPFYQIYEGATILAGAESRLVNCNETTGLADFSQVTDAEWQQTALLYLCSPGNPTGAVIPEADLHALIAKAIQFDFIIASDECYSEIYQDEQAPPVGLLQAAANMGNADFKQCLVFHSLSKRSNLPGLRSGFVAGDANVIANFLRYRTYHGCSMSVPVQIASAAAWADETHVRANRALYRQKFAAFKRILGDSLDLQIPEASFYLWPQLPISGEAFALRLYRDHNVVVLPSVYLSRNNNGIPGQNRVRMALVAEVSACEDAAQRIKQCLEDIRAEG